jgi:hypothetical protein
VFKVVLRERDEDAALTAVSLMKQGRIIDLSFELAIQAAKTSTDHKIPMADRFFPAPRAPIAQLQVARK